VCVCVCVCVCVFCTQELKTQSTVTTIAGLYKFSVKKLLKSHFGPSDNYSWSNVIFYLENNILSPNFNASSNKIFALFKTTIWNSKPILLHKSFESQNTKDCWHKSIMKFWHSELFVCFCAHSKSRRGSIKIASSVSPYLHTKKLYSSWTNFNEIWYWKFLLKFTLYSNFDESSTNITDPPREALWLHVECKSLNNHWSEICFEETLSIKVGLTFHFQCIFS